MDYKEFRNKLLHAALSAPFPKEEAVKELWDIFEVETTALEIAAEWYSQQNNRDKQECLYEFRNEVKRRKGFEKARQENAVLCLIKGNTAWFTTAPKQGGDSWCGSPHYYSAGEPWEEHGYKVFKVYFEVDGEIQRRSYSVEEINYGLRPWFYFDGNEVILAGTKYHDFINAIKKHHGVVYEAR